MRELNTKRRVRGLFYSPVTIAFIVILTVFFTRGTWGLYQKSAAAKVGRDQVEKELVEISQRETFLKAELATLSTAAGVEKKMREKFNVKREGEEVAVIVRQKEAAASAEAPIKTWFHGFIVNIVDFFQ